MAAIVSQPQPQVSHALPRGGDHKRRTPFDTSPPSPVNVFEDTEHRSSPSLSSSPLRPSASMSVFELDSDDVRYIHDRVDYYADLYKRDIGARLSALLARHEADKQTIAAQHRAIEQLQLNIAAATKRGADAYDRQQQLRVRHQQLRDKFLQERESQRNRTLVINAFSEWRENTLSEYGSQSRGHSHHGSRSGDRTVETYYARLLLKSVLTAWRGATRATRSDRDEQRWQHKYEAIRASLESEHAAQIDALKQEIRGMSAVIKARNEEKERVAERMRQAFARGVCALNKEALAAFDVHSHGGSEEEKRDDEDLPFHYQSAQCLSGNYGAQSSVSGGAAMSANSPASSGSVVSFQPIPLRLTAPYQPGKCAASAGLNHAHHPAVTLSQVRRRPSPEPRPRTTFPSPTPTSSRGTSISMGSSNRGR